MVRRCKIETQHLEPSGARKEDMTLLSSKTYHFPVLMKRILRKIQLYGGVTLQCGPPIHFTQNALLQAFINVHTPIMSETTSHRFKEMVSKSIQTAKCPKNVCALLHKVLERELHSAP